MKRGIRIVAIIFLLVVIFAAEKSYALDINAQTGLHFDWWKSNVQTKGRQIYIPIKIDGQYRRVSYGILSGYAYTHYDSNGAEAQSLKNILDTKLNISYEFFDIFPVNTILGLDLNLPTGERNLREENYGLLTDSDLYSITSLGEGFNINPTLNFSKEWENWVGGIGFGYVWRGEYDLTSNISDYDPGDIFNMFAEMDYDFSLEWRGRFFTNYAYYHKDKVQGQDFYQEGAFLLFGMGLHYDRIKWEADAVLQGIFRGKSKFPTGFTGVISKEDRNNHGDEWILDFSLRYYLDELTTIKSFLEVLRVDENDYPIDDIRFVSGREKFALGAGIKRELTPNLDAELDIRGFLMEEKSTNRERYQGFSIGAKLVTTF
jgi:hypothetical protein